MFENLFPHRESRVHCIENFDDLSGRGGHLREEFIENAKRGGRELQIQLYEGTSAEILAWMIAEEGYWEGFDFVHHAGGGASSLADACQAWNLLKPGGIMVFSGVGNDADPSIRAARDVFLAAYADQLQVIRDGARAVVSKVLRNPHVTA